MRVVRGQIVSSVPPQWIVHGVDPAGQLSICECGQLTVASAIRVGASPGWAWFCLQPVLHWDCQPDSCCSSTTLAC